MLVLGYSPSASLRRSYLLTRKDFANDVFDWNFLNIYVCDRQFVQQSLAYSNDAVPLYLQPDGPARRFDEFTVFAQVFARARAGLFTLNRDEFEIRKAIEDFTETAIEE